MEGNHYWTSEIVNIEDLQPLPNSVNASSYKVINDEDPSINNNETEAINSRIERTNQYLESDLFTDEVIDTDTSSETYSDSKDSTYVNESDEDAISVPTEINSEDFSFNIQNAYEAHMMDNSNIESEGMDIVPTNKVGTHTNESSSISNIDTPIMSISKDGKTEVDSDSTSYIEWSEKDHIQCF